MILDYFKIPWKEIKRRQLRSWLTLLGVFIGIAAIVSLITLGQGLENAINKQFEALGKDKLFITPKGGTISGMGSSVTLTDDDLETIRQTSGIKVVAPMGYLSGRYEFNDLVRYNYVAGIPLDPEEQALILDAESMKIAQGRMLRKGDKYKIVLGYQYTLPSLFEQFVELDDKILVNGQEFKVIGFMEKIGSPPDDRMGLIALDTYGEIYDKKGEYGFIIAQTEAGEDPIKVGEKVEEELRQARNVDKGEEDFQIQTPEQFAESFQTILNIVQIVLIGIAGISLLVGGIGIMNTMYTTVMERTKEIGVMKAIGAKNSHILSLVLIESGFYGLGGGLIGVVFGIGLAKLVELGFIIAVGPAFLSITIDWWLILGTLIFSFIVGCLSGIAPARKASKLNPVEALRYE